MDVPAASWIADRAASVHDARARWTATGCTSIPITESRSFPKTSSGLRPPSRAASITRFTASTMNVPDPHAGSRTRWFSGSETSSSTIVRASQSGV